MLVSLFAEDAVLEKGFTEAARAAGFRMKFDADQQAFAAHFANVPARDLGQALLEVLADLGRVLGETFVANDLQRRSCDGRCERIAPEGRAMLARLKQAKHAFVRKHRRHRIDASTQGLAEDHDVRAHVLVIAAQEPPGAAQSSLNLVGHKQDVVPARQSRHRFEVAVRRHNDAGFTLDRLEQDGAGIRVDRGFDSAGVAVGDDDEARRERAEVVAIKRLGRERDDRDRATLEVSGNDDDLRLVAWDPFCDVAPFARDLDRGLDGLGTRVHGQCQVVAEQIMKILIQERELVVAEGA